LRENSKTEMIITKIDFDIAIPDGIFTERNLREARPLPKTSCHGKKDAYINKLEPILRA
jgi:hypothetical protein